MINLGAEPDFRLGRMTVRPSASEIELDGATQHIEPRAMQVLAALARADAVVVSRDELIRTCWSGNVVGDDAINRVVARLRRLSQETAAGFTIETIPKVGYRLLPPAPATSPATGQGAAQAVAPEMALPEDLAAAASDLAAPRRFDWRRWIEPKPASFVMIAIIALLFAASVAGLAVMRREPENVIVMRRPATIAVLPFDSFGGDPKSTVFAEGFSSELHHALARSGPGPQLIGRSSSFMFRGEAKRLADIREQLGVTHVVDGTVERQGDQITVSVELVDALSGREIWNDKVSADLADLENLLHRIVVRVRSGLDVEQALGGAGRQLDPRALDLYFSTEIRQGEAYAEEQRAAIAAMKSAVTIEPGFTRAWAKLIEACIMYRWYGPTFELREEARLTGIEAGKRLVDLAPDDVETWLLLSRLEDGAANGGSYERRAEEIDPDNPYVLLARSYRLSRHGKGVRALELIDRARVLNPLEERMQWGQFKALAVADQSARVEALLQDTPPEIAVNVWPSVIMDWFVKRDFKRAETAVEKFGAAVEALEQASAGSPALAVTARRWHGEFVSLATALRGSDPALRRTMLKRVIELVQKPQGLFDERGAVYRMYLPMIALLSDVDTAIRAWSDRMDIVSRPGTDPAQTASEQRLEANAWHTMAFNSGFRDLHRDPRFWSIAVRYTPDSMDSMPLEDWASNSELWAPDFCGEPDFPYDCTQAAKAVLRAR